MSSTYISHYHQQAHSGWLNRNLEWMDIRPQEWRRLQATFLVETLPLHWYNDKLVCHTVTPCQVSFCGQKQPQPFFSMMEDLKHKHFGAAIGHSMPAKVHISNHCWGSSSPSMIGLRTWDPVLQLTRINCISIRQELVSIEYYRRAIF